MSNSSSQEPPGKQELLTAQIIVGALAAGCVFFLLIVLFLLQKGAAPDGEKDWFLTYFAIGFAVMALIARMIVPSKRTVAKP